MPPDGRVDRSGILLEIAADDALVGPRERVVFELRGKMRMRKVVFCRDQEPRRVLVNPVDNAGALFSADTGEGVSAVVQKCIDDRSVRMPRRGVDDKALGLVDDDHVAVFIADIERNVLRLQVRLGGFRKCDVQNHTRARLFVLFKRVPLEGNKPLL